MSSLTKIHMKAIYSPSATGQRCKKNTRGEEQGARTGKFSLSSSSTGGSFSLLLHKLRLSNQLFVLDYLPKSHRPAARSVFRKATGLQPLVTPAGWNPVSPVTATRGEVEPVAFMQDSPYSTFHLRRFMFSVHFQKPSAIFRSHEKSSSQAIPHTFL